MPVGRFNKTNLRPIIAAWGSALPASLDGESIKSQRAKVTAEEKDILPNLSPNLYPIETDWRIGVALLSEQIGSTTTLARLVEQPDIGNWVEEGLHIHEGKSRCEFCEGLLTSERLIALNAHFSVALDDLKIRISKSIEILSNRKMVFTGDVYARSAFYTDLQPEHLEAGKNLGQVRDAFNAKLQQLIDCLEVKLGAPSDIVPPPGEPPQIKLIEETVTRFQKLIIINNERSRGFTTA